MEAGHFSASGIYDHLREVALKYAFYMHALSACTDDGGGGGRPLHDYAFIATACLAGLVVLVGAVPLRRLILTTKANTCSFCM